MAVSMLVAMVMVMLMMFVAVLMPVGAAAVLLVSAAGGRFFVLVQMAHFSFSSDTWAKAMAKID